MPMETLLQTKLYAPHRRSADYVTRQRLLARLDAAQSAKVTLIAAPAGFGKTTLVTDWLAHRGRNAAWLSLDEGDSDPVVFWRYLIAALQTQSTELGEEVAQLLQTPQPPALQPLLARLINEIVSRQAPFLLVLDDYHTVAHPEIDDSLLFFIEHMPPNFHLIVTSRVDPNLPLARLRVRRELVEIRTDDLRFTSAEAAVFLTQESGMAIPVDVVTALETRTEGWIAGLQMAALSLQNTSDPASFVDAFGGSHRYVMDYLTDEVLERQPADVHSFLLHTSILDRFCADLCEAVLANEPALAGQSRRLLTHLDRANLFLIALDDEGRWYRYHHLFADLLRRRLYQQPRVDVADLHQSAARWHAAQGHTDEAIHHFLAGADSESAADLVQEQGESMLFRGEIKKLWSWVSALPQSCFSTRPLLALFASWIHYFRQEPQAAVPMLDLVDRYVANTALADAERRRMVGQVTVMRGWVAQAQGEVVEAIAILRRALDLLPIDEANYRGLASFFLGWLLLDSGEIEAGIDHTETAAQLSRRVGNYNAYLGTQTILSQVENQRGHAYAARLRLEEALRWLTQHKLDQLPLAGDLHLGLGDLLYQSNQVDLAVARYEAARTIVVSYFLNTRLDLSLHLALAHHHIRQGSPEAAAAELMNIEGKTAGRPLSAELDGVEREMAALYLHLGNLERARRLLGVTPDPTNTLDAALQLVLARLWFMEGQTQRRPDRLAAATQLLQTALATHQAQGNNRRVAQIAILQARLFSAQGEEIAAHAALATALAAVPVDDYAGLFLDEGDALRPLLVQFAADARYGHLHGAARGLLRHFGRDELAESASPQAAAEDESPQLALPEPLTERELETLRLLASDLSTEEIADHLVVAVSTVRSYTKRIYAKLEVHSRIEALHKARLFGVLIDEEQTSAKKN
jgi:LuxR family maltose regulon positive regulatory protein